MEADHEFSNCQLIQWTAASEESLKMTSIGYQSEQAPFNCQDTSYSGTWATSEKNEEPQQSPTKAELLMDPTGRS